MKFHRALAVAASSSMMLSVVYTTKRHALIHLTYRHSSWRAWLATSNNYVMVWMSWPPSSNSSSLAKEGEPDDKAAHTVMVVMTMRHPWLPYSLSLSPTWYIIWQMGLGYSHHPYMRPYLSYWLRNGQGGGPWGLRQSINVKTKASLDYPIYAYLDSS